MAYKLSIRMNLDEGIKKQIKGIPRKPFKSSREARKYVVTRWGSGSADLFEVTRKR